MPTKSPIKGLFDLDYNFDLNLKFTIYKSFGNRSNRRKGMLESVRVSTGCPIRSSIYPFVPGLALPCSVPCRSPNCP